MYISHTNFLEKLQKHQSDISWLISLFEITQKLLARYGKKLSSQKVLQTITALDSSLGNFVALLITYNKLSLKTIKQFLSLLKKNGENYKKQLIVSSSTQLDTKNLQKDLLKKVGNCEIETTSTQELELKIKGDWYVYKRSLSLDLDKLLA